MSKGNGKGGAAAAATATVVAKKSTKGIPRVTNAVRAMDQAGQDKWFAEKVSMLSAEVQAEIKARLAAPKAAKGQGHQIDYAKKFNAMTIEQLVVIKGMVEESIASVGTRVESDLDRIIAKATQEKAALVAARLSKAEKVG